MTDLPCRWWHHIPPKRTTLHDVMTQQQARLNARVCAVLLATLGAALQDCQLLANTQRREEDVRPTVYLL